MVCSLDLAETLKRRIRWENGRINGNAVLHWISYNIFIFPLAGYFFEHRVKEFWNKRKVLFLWGINIGVILFSCYLTYFKAKTSQGDDIMYLQTFHNTFVLVNGIALFVTLQYINSHTNLFLKMEKNKNKWIVYKK